MYTRTRLLLKVWFLYMYTVLAVCIYMKQTSSYRLKFIQTICASKMNT